MLEKLRRAWSSRPRDAAARRSLEELRRSRRGYLLALAGGATGGVCWLALGPAPLFFPLYPLLFFRSLRAATTDGQAIRIGLLFGAARYAVASHFLLALIRHSPLAVAFYLLAIAYILPYAVVESWGAFRLERHTGVPRAVWAAILYTLMEWVRSVGDLSFPADLLAHGLGRHPAWLGWSPWLGTFGISLLIFLVGALLDQAWERRGSVRAAAGWLAAGLALWAAPAATSLVTVPPAEAAPRGALRVGIVQPCAGVAEKHEPARWPGLWGRMERLTEQAASDADLVVWPETARPGWVRWDASLPFRDAEMEALSRKVGVPILYGCEIARVEGGAVRIYNGAALARPDGGAADWYGKQRLLPFVEGVPFARVLGWDPASRAARRGDGPGYLSMLGNFTPGPRPTLFEVGSARIGVLVCYEGQYPQLARTYRRTGANLLAVITNDGWWGHSAFPAWHAQMVGARAREAGIPVIRAANNGVSSFTDAAGRLRRRAALDETTVLRVSVQPGAPGRTPYVRTGPLVVVAGWMLVATGAARGLWRRRQG